MLESKNTAAASTAATVVPPLRAGVRKARKITPAEKAEWDTATEVAAFNVASLSPTERKQVDEVAAACAGLVIKGLLHRHDPKTYPVPADATAPEAYAAASMANLPNKMFETLRPQLVQFAQTGAGLAKVSPAVQKIDFKAPSIVPALQALAPSVGLKHHTRAAEHAVLTKSPPKYHKLQLALRSLRCFHETAGLGGSDEIVMGAVLVGASGHVSPVPAFYCGQFDTPSDGYNDYYADFGQMYFGEYKLATTPGYPKDFFCVFQLVETDDDIKDDVANVTHALHSIADTFGPLTGGVSVIAGGIVQAIGALIGLFISDVNFTPYGVMLRLHDENGLGPSGESKLHKTGHIRTDEADYVIAFRWLLVA